MKTTGEVVFMIVYDPLWETMRRRGITTYALIKNYSFSRGTLDSLKQNRNISTATLIVDLVYPFIDPRIRYS